MEETGKGSNAFLKIYIIKKRRSFKKKSVFATVTILKIAT